MENVEQIDSANGTEEAAFEMPRKANDVMLEAMGRRPQPALFDGFWQTGEVALMFGAAGIGKSLLAVQLAEALARGRPIDGFVMPRRQRRRVLYVDLNLSDVQFQRRYTTDGAKPKPYKFAERFYRGRPGVDEDLCSWVSKMVRVGGFEVVVIDDLSAVMRTDDGTFDSLRIMRAIKRLSHATGVSVLVLADSSESSRHDLSESDLRRSRVLCGVADSVFAIGRGGKRSLKLIQFRSQGAEIVWNSRNPVGCDIVRDDNGLLGLAFDERFQRKTGDERSRLIVRVVDLLDEGMTFREIGRKLGITKSRASRLADAWTPAMHEAVHGEGSVEGAEPEDDEYPDEPPELEDEEGWDEVADEGFIDVTPVNAESSEASPRKQLAGYGEFVPENVPFAAGLGRRSIYDLERGFDAAGREIFVESAEMRTGNPTVWYRVEDRTGTVIRSHRTALAVSHKRIGKSGWI